MLWSPRLAPTSTMSPPLEIGVCSRAKWYSSFGTSRLRRCSELSFGCCTSHMHRPSAIFTAVGGSVRLRSLIKLLRLPKSSLPNLLTSGGKDWKLSPATGAALRQDTKRRGRLGEGADADDEEDDDEGDENAPRRHFLLLSVA